MNERAMKIRTANTDDIPELIPLMAELGYPCTLEALTLRFQRFTQNLGYGVAVCNLNHEIVGFVAWSKSDLFTLDKVRLHIEGIAVASEYRGKGVGKRLMAFVEDVAQEYAPAIVDLTSGLRRAKDGSHEFYKSLGYNNEGYMAKLYLRKEL